MSLFVSLYIIFVVYIQKDICVHIPLLVQWPEESQVFSVTPTYSLETRSLTELRARLVARKPRECHVSATHGTDITDNKTAPPFFVLGAENLNSSPKTSAITILTCCTISQVPKPIFVCLIQPWLSWKSMFKTRQL